tara:strand:- start:5760 stop:7439 length:1680 start_codon:yes stop_codon:yes gene_type:complete
MEEKKDTGLDITSITLSNYVRPAIVENKSRNWVLNGRNNEFYQYIIDRHNGSPTNSSINSSYIDLIYGRGLSYSNGVRGTNDWARLQSILRPKDLRKIISDWQIFGEFSFQVIETKGKELSSIVHVPKPNVVPSIANEDNEIESYWFSRDWAKTSQNKPEEFPAFGSGGGKIQVYVGKPYKVGKIYFADPEYLAGLPYCEMEEEIANLNVNYIQKGLSAGYIISVPDGKDWTAEVKSKFKKNIQKKLTGSPNSGDFVLSFNGRDQEAIQVESFPVNENIHKQWSFLVEEAKQQILTSHRATSPSIVGIVSSSGFSNTADEMDMAEKQLYKRVIRPKQDFILEAIEEVLVQYGINLDLKFLPLTEEVAEPVAMCSHVEMSSDENQKMYDLLDSYALDMSEDYDLTDGSEYELQLSANQTSEQDSALWKIRYAYVKGTSKSPEGGSRAFCNRMRGLEMTGKVYRKEDIELMSSQGVNGQFAHSGGKYDIFLYGGGVNCYHRWERRIFKKKLNADGTPKKGGALATTTEVNVSEAKRQGAKIPKNDADVAKAEIDKPRKGKF